MNSTLSRVSVIAAGATFALGSVLVGSANAAQETTPDLGGSESRLVHPVADGERPSNQPGDAGAMIVGGSQASSAPFIAALHANGQFNCTASVIAPQWIITAKHCVGAGASGLSFRVGSLSRSSGGSVVKASQVINSPGNNDVSLVKLASSVQTPPIKVAATGSLRVGTRETVYGWGYTSSNWTNLAERLKTSSGSVTQLNCATNFGDIACIKNNGDTAGGDSGGPMVNGSGELIGVCAIGNKPTDGSGFGGYNTVVSTTVRSWIKQTAGV